MQDQLFQIGIFTVVGFLLGGVLLLKSRIIQWLCGINYPTKVKGETYECGMKSFHDTNIQYDVKYYLFALIFIVFDVEFVFLVPWATIFNLASNQIFLLIEAFIFVALLVLGLAYAWRKGVLEIE